MAEDGAADRVQAGWLYLSTVTSAVCRSSPYLVNELQRFSTPDSRRRFYAVQSLTSSPFHRPVSSIHCQQHADRQHFQPERALK